MGVVHSQEAPNPERQPVRSTETGSSNKKIDILRNVLCCNNSAGQTNAQEITEEQIISRPTTPAEREILAEHTEEGGERRKPSDEINKIDIQEIAEKQVEMESTKSAEHTDQGGEHKESSDEIIAKFEQGLKNFAKKKRDNERIKNLEVKDSTIPSVPEGLIVETDSKLSSPYNAAKDSQSGPHEENLQSNNEMVSPDTKSENDFNVSQSQHDQRQYGSLEYDSEEEFFRRRSQPYREDDIDPSRSLHDQRQYGLLEYDSEEEFFRRRSQPYREYDPRSAEKHSNVLFKFQAKNNRDLADDYLELHTTLQNSYGDEYLQVLQEKSGEEISQTDLDEFDQAIERTRDNANSVLTKAGDHSISIEQLEQDKQELETSFEKLFNAYRATIRNFLEGIERAENLTESVEYDLLPEKFANKAIIIQDALMVRKGEKYANAMADRLEAIAQRAGMTKLSLWANIRIANAWNDQPLHGKNADLFAVMKDAPQFTQQWEKEEPVWKAIIETNRYLDKFEEYQKISQEHFLQGLDNNSLITEERFDNILKAAQNYIQNAQKYLDKNEYDEVKQKEVIKALNDANEGFKNIDDKMPAKLKSDFKEIESGRVVSPEPTDKSDNQIDTIGTFDDLESLCSNFKIIGKSTEIELVRELEKAKIVCLGEVHADERQPALFAKCINTVGKKHAIVVLVEAIQTRKEVLPVSNNITKLTSGEFRVFGWDNAVLHTVTLINLKEAAKSEPQTLLDAWGDRLPYTNEKKRLLDLQFSLLRRAHKMAEERNQTLLDTIDYVRDKFPDKTVFVIGGNAHFTEDTILNDELNKRQGIRIEPLLDVSPDTLLFSGSQNIEQQYYNESDITTYLRRLALLGL